MSSRNRSRWEEGSARRAGWLFREDVAFLPDSATLAPRPHFRYRRRGLDSPEPTGCGDHIRSKVAAGGSEQGACSAPAKYLRNREPTLRGVSASHLWRMTQFYQTDRGRPKLATLVRVLARSHKQGSTAARLREISSGSASAASADARRLVAP